MANFTYRKKVSLTLILFSILIVYSSQLNAQASQTVSEIITTYNGYFKSSTSAVNPVNPDNNHDLLAFSYNGTRYSTGVNDALLAANGDGAFSTQVFKSLPLNGLTGAVSTNTKLALGQMVDGVDNGASIPPPENNMIKYLTDGANGLNLGTGVANLPAGNLSFNITNINPLSIGDGVPDILITQIADPSAGVDKYEFTNASNTTVGTVINISFSGINAVANWTADFYEASKNPPTLTATFTKTSRPVRLWAADFSYFGITAANYSSISKFIIHLNGNSDIAFIAYNEASAFITLPLTLSLFESRSEQNDVVLKWQTSSESNSDYFIIETSTDGIHFKKAGRVNATGNSTLPVNYTFSIENVSEGIHYYRLQFVDKDGSITYSKIVQEKIKNGLSIRIAPNPATEKISVMHPAGMKGDVLKICAADGKLIFLKEISSGSTKTVFDIESLATGNYILQWARPGYKSFSSVLLVK